MNFNTLNRSSLDAIFRRLITHRFIFQDVGLQSLWPHSFYFVMRVLANQSYLLIILCMLILFWNDRGHLILFLPWLVHFIISLLGFHLSATVTAPQNFNQGQGKGSFNVAVVFDRRRISSCSCSCNSSASWCCHIVALCLFRIHQVRSNLEMIQHLLICGPRYYRIEL